jgi:2-aminoadipate transaminase
MTTQWAFRYAHRIQAIRSSAIRELLKLTQNPEMISFAGGMPAPELFPVDEFKAACERVLSKHGQSALQYSTTEGYPPLRELISGIMAREGVAVKAENILITASSQQALDLVAKLLINRGEHVLVESPTYLGAMQAFNVFGPEYMPVPTDDEGLRPETLESVLPAGPKFMYILPNFHNPAGITLSLNRRCRIVELADRWGVPIVEDDPYGQLRYEGEHLPPLIALDAQNLKTVDDYREGNIIYLSTFSKTLAPGLRLGWIAAPPDVVAKLCQLKQGADLHTSTFTQMVAYEVARDGFLEKHIEKIRKVYGERRDIMLEALAEYLPSEVSWTHPAGGLFLWARLPQGMDSSKLFEIAVKQNVAFVPGASFFAVPDHDTNRYLRLNFSYMQPNLIVEGIRRIGVAVKEQMKNLYRDSR